MESKDNQLETVVGNLTEIQTQVRLLQQMMASSKNPTERAIPVPSSQPYVDTKVIESVKDSLQEAD